MTTVAVVVSILAVAALAWIGGEAHCQGCVASAVAVTQGVRPLPSVNDQLGGTAVPDNGERVDAVKGCSRLPF
jgi:hypothetical protein